MNHKPTYEELEKRVEELTADLTGANNKLEQQITLRKQVEDELHVAKALLQTAMDQSQAGIAIADAPDGNLRYVNKAGLLIRGKSEQEIVHEIDINQYVSSWQILHFDGTPYKSDEVPLAKAILYGESCSEEFIIRRPNDEDRIVLANAAPIFDEKGKVKAGIVVFLDITERKQTEDNLIESEARFRSTFEQAAVGIAHIGLDGKWLRVNQKLCKIVGYSHEELFQLTFQDITHSDDIDADLEYVSKMLAGTINTYSMEKRYYRKDKNIVWINLTVSLVRDVENNPQYFISIVEDISTRKHIETELNEYKDKLEKKVFERTEKLQKALSEIKTLRGILPLCSFCKKIRDDQGYWEQVDVYIHKHSEADISHSLCPDCMKKHYPEEYQRLILKK